MCVSRVFFSVQFPDFYAKSQSLYAKLAMLFSKLPGFYAKSLIKVSTHERCPVRLSGVRDEGRCARESHCAKIFGGVYSNG